MPKVTESANRRSGDVVERGCSSGLIAADDDKRNILHTLLCRFLLKVVTISLLEVNHKNCTSYK